MPFRAMKIGNLKQIRKPEAYKRFCRLEPVVICAANLRPGPPWSPEYRLGPDQIRELIADADRYGPAGICPSGQLWKGDVFATAWDCLMNSVAAYMLDSERGQYPRFYVEV